MGGGVRLFTHNIDSLHMSVLMVFIVSRFMRRYQGLMLLFLGFVRMVFMLGAL